MKYDFPYLPATFVPSLLFGVATSEVERKMLEEVIIAEADGVKLIYSGIDLRSDDKEVFVQLLRRAAIEKAAGKEGGIQLSFTGRQMSADLRKIDSKDFYDFLYAAIHRLQRGSICIERVSYSRRERFQSRLVPDFTLEDDDENQPMWTITISENILQMFKDST